MPANSPGCTRTMLSKNLSAKYDESNTAHDESNKHCSTIKVYKGKYFTCRSFWKKGRESFLRAKKTVQNFTDNRLSLCAVIIKINNECRLE